MTNVQLPTRPDGTHYPCAFLTPDETYVGETLTDLVSQLIPEYANLDGPNADHTEDPSFLARSDALALRAEFVQEVMRENHPEDLQTLSPEEFDAAMCPRAERPAHGVTEWTREMPLILLATLYAPFSSVAPVTGDNVIYANPYTELTFLKSLRALDVGELFLRDESAEEQNTPEQNTVTSNTLGDAR